MKKLITILFLISAYTSFSQTNTVKIISAGGGVVIIDTTNKWTNFVSSNATGDSLIVIKNGVRSAYKYPATSSNGWNLTGNTNPAEPDSSTVLGTLNSTSLRLQTKGKNHLIIDTFGVVHIQDSVRNQLDLQRTGAGGRGNHLYIGNVGDAYVTQNPLDNVRFHVSTGVGQWMRNLTFDEYQNNPSISEYLEHDGSGAEVELGQDGISFWTSDYSTAGTHNLRLVSQNGVNGNFGIHVQIPKYDFQLNPTAGATTMGLYYNNGTGGHGEIIWTDVGDGVVNNDTWRISNMSKLNPTLPNIFGIEQGKNIAGTVINQYRLLVGDMGNVGIGTQTAPDSSAKLEIKSTTQGLLLPRMTATQGSAISSPTDGLMIYVTDTNGTFTSIGFWGRVSGAWAKLNN